MLGAYPLASQGALQSVGLKGVADFNGHPHTLDFSGRVILLLSDRLMTLHVMRRPYYYNMHQSCPRGISPEHE